MEKDQSGFTLIELVVVITILGILAATALPRFLDVQEDAHESAVEGAKGGLSAGVNLARSKATVEGTAAGASVDIDGDGTPDVTVSGDGWPVGSPSDDASVGSESDCVGVWEGVMQNPPSVSTTGDNADYYAKSYSNCIFEYEKDGGTKQVEYNSTNGEVTYNP